MKERRGGLEKQQNNTFERSDTISQQNTESLWIELKILSNSPVKMHISWASSPLKHDPAPGARFCLIESAQQGGLLHSTMGSLSGVCKLRSKHCQPGQSMSPSNRKRQSSKKSYVALIIHECQAFGEKGDVRSRTAGTLRMPICPWHQEQRLRLAKWRRGRKEKTAWNLFVSSVLENKRTGFVM